MAITGRGRFPLRSAWGFRVRSRKAGGAFLSKMVRFGDTDTADSVVLKDFFFPTSGASYNLTAATGAFVQTGVAAALKVDNRLPITVGTFTETGIAAALRRGVRITSALGTFTYSGIATNFRVANKLPTSPGTFNWTTINATIKAGRRLNAQHLSLPGVPGELTADASGTTVTLDWLAATSATYLAHGNTVSFRKGYLLSPTAQTYTSTFRDARIFKMPAALIAEHPISTPTITNADAVSTTINLDWVLGPMYSMVGNDAGVGAGRKLSATVRTYALTGNSVNFGLGATMPATTGAYTHTGNAAALRLGRGLRAEMPLGVPTGLVATTINGNSVSMDWQPPAMFSFTGASTGGVRTLTTATGAFTFTGNNATLSYGVTNFFLTAATGAFALTGRPATFPQTSVLTVLPGSYVLTGNNANLSISVGQQPVNDPTFIDMNTNKTFVNFSTGITQITMTTNKTYIDIE